MTQFILRCLLAGLMLSSRFPARTEAGPPQVAQGSRGMVVSVSAPATAAGVKILQQKGSAVDAAVAVALALQVTWPEAGNIGGGGFMLVHPAPNQPPVCIEYRETAPQASTPGMFSLSDSVLTAQAVGVPGTLRGLELAHQKYGRLPWKDIVAPSVQLARDGFPVDEGLARSLNGVLAQTDRNNPLFAEMIRLYGKPDGSPWKPGDSLVQPDLAKTLEEISRTGAGAFYEGVIADRIIEEMERSRGIITREDLKAYQARIREPIRIPYRDVEIYAPPLPSSGGYCLTEMLQILKHFDSAGEPRWSARTIHFEVEAMRRAYLDRALYLGDSDFVTVPERLLTPAHADELATTIDPDHATPSRELAPDLPVVEESPSTTHFSIIDGSGMAVSNTYTLEHSFGSRVAVRNGGFLLNNEMGDFNWKAGHTDLRGRIGTKANLIAPGKRMLSSQTPVIVLRKGETVLVTGSPGGRTIINTVFCVLRNVIDYGQDLPTAISQPRLHHQWLPDQIRIEQLIDQVNPALVAQLQAMGHKVVVSASQGDAHSIQRNPGTGELTGVADGRLSGSAQGF